MMECSVIRSAAHSPAKGLRERLYLQLVIASRAEDQRGPVMLSLVACRRNQFSLYHGRMTVLKRLK